MQFEQLFAGQIIMSVYLGNQIKYVYFHFGLLLVFLEDALKEEMIGRERLFKL